jgi:hypothetical protein
MEKRPQTQRIGMQHTTRLSVKEKGGQAILVLVILAALVGIIWALS